MEGVKKRREHPPYPEPDVIMIFKKENSPDSNEETMRKVERNLKEEMKRVRTSYHLYRLINSNIYVETPDE